MVDSLSNIKFEIESDGSVLANAKVSLNGQDAMTDQYGMVSFNDLLRDSIYNYSVHLSGYESVEGDVYLEKDTIISINMVLETGVDGIALFMAEVYPNPAKDMLWINSTVENYRVEIVNTYGQIVLQNKYSDTRGAIDISAVQPGAYMLLLTDRKNNRIWKSVIITK